MKFLVPNYSCLQNPWLGDYHPQIPVLSVLNWICWTPPPKKIPGYATEWHQVNTNLILVAVTERSVAVTRHIRKVGAVVELWERNVQGKRSMSELIATHLEFLSCYYQRTHPLRMQLMQTKSNNGNVCTCVMKCLYVQFVILVLQCHTTMCVAVLTLRLPD